MINSDVKHVLFNIAFRSLFAQVILYTGNREECV